MIINLSQTTSIQELHQLFKEQLGFPDFYGMNWDAFWDAITGLVEMPKDLGLEGFDIFKSNFPNDAQILKDLIHEYNKNYGQIEIK